MSTSPRILGGRYEVGELVGRGGMAEVHAGYDTRLGRPVAIKILRADLARDASFLHRFRREAQASAGLNHANIVAVYDSGEDTFVEATGGSLEIPYIVMEFIDGQTLRQVLNDEKKLSPDEACRVIMGVLSALEYSHSKGIVHRDIKPGNVMVTRGGSVKVMDFGIARALADAAATMTSQQTVVGTARYLSPEQAQGQSVDGRSDLYSAGCLLFELLTGRAPFIGEPVSLVYQHIGEQPQPPSLYDQNISPDLDAVVLHSLEKKREDRYQDAGDFRADVLAARSGQPISEAAAASKVTSTDYTEVVSYGGASEASDHTAPLEETEQNSSRGGLWAIAGVLALIAILGIGYLFFNQPNKTAKVTVTKVVGMTYEQAQQTLGQSFNVHEKQVASNQSEDTVLTQNPTAGTKADVGSDVTLTVSTGPNSVSVPDVSDNSVDGAKATLQAAGINPDRIKVSDQHKDDTGIDAGKVAATTPAAGASLGSNDTITLYVSSGKATVPDVTNQDQNAATSALYKAHLSVDVKDQETTDDSKVGKVVSEPQKGQKLPDGSAVTVYIGRAAPKTVTSSASASQAPSEPAQQPAHSSAAPVVVPTSVSTSAPAPVTTQAPVVTPTTTTPTSTSSSTSSSSSSSTSTK